MPYRYAIRTGDKKILNKNIFIRSIKNFLYWKNFMLPDSNEKRMGIKKVIFVWISFYNNYLISYYIPFK